VEEVLNSKVPITLPLDRKHKKRVEEVLNHKVETTTA